MNFENSQKLRTTIEQVLENESRINEHKPVRYWYPLSLATYGVEEIMEALDSLCAFRTSMAEKTLQFERSFTKFQGCADSVMVNSGSSADLLLCFLLTNPLNPLLKRGDEILMPVVTWPTQIWSAMMAGLNVKLVDVRPDTLNIDIEDLRKKITPKTKALFLVHLMGNPCEMDSIINLVKEHKLLLLEDCCEGLGSEWAGTKVGNFGIGGAFSFFFSHHMTTMEGGMVSCSSNEMAEQLKLLRAHGWLRNVDVKKYHLNEFPEIDPRYAFVNWGFNLRPTEIQAGFGLRQLEKLPVFNEKREKASNRIFGFIEKSKWLSTPTVHAKAKPSWLATPIMLKENAPFKRSELTEYLEKEGVETRPIVTGNIAKQPVTRIFKDSFEGHYPGADNIHQNGFYIGLSPLSTDSDISRLEEVFSKFVSKY
ncbi:MAG: DegT/DnrJ/EryC1/StrS family aminotransferase [Bacteriovoracia bacterium]